jgi:hypothetical protein
MFPCLPFPSLISSSFVLRCAFCGRRRFPTKLAFGLLTPFPNLRAYVILPLRSRMRLAGISLRDLFRSFHSLHKTCPYSVVFTFSRFTHAEYEIILILATGVICEFLESMKISLKFSLLW